MQFHHLPDHYRDVGGEALSAQRITFSDYHNIAGKICGELTKTAYIGISEIADSLASDGLVTRDADYANSVTQLIFATIGMLSMLFTPSTAAAANMLALDVPDSGFRRQRLSDAWVVREQKLEDCQVSNNCPVLDA